MIDASEFTMGLRDMIKRRLPILGSSGPAPSGPASGGVGGRSSGPAPRPTYTTTEAPAEPKSARGDAPVAEFIDKAVKGNAVAIFMKGTPQSPACGFSASASSILSGYGQPYYSFDVYSDPEVREGIKQYSNWPTIPQVFISGEFVGGADILKQLHDSGELKGMIEGAKAATSSGS
jgi:monothiol glutaredoxin